MDLRRCALERTDGALGSADNTRQSSVFPPGLHASAGVSAVGVALVASAAKGLLTKLCPTMVRTQHCMSRVHMLEHKWTLIEHRQSR